MHVGMPVNLWVPIFFQWVWWVSVVLCSPQNMSLFAGSMSGDVGKVKEVLKQGADPNWHNVFYVSCLLQVMTNDENMSSKSTAM